MIGRLADPTTMRTALTQQTHNTHDTRYFFWFYVSKTMIPARVCTTYDRLCGTRRKNITTSTRTRTASTYWYDTSIIISIQLLLLVASALLLLIVVCWVYTCKEATPDLRASFVTAHQKARIMKASLPLLLCREPGIYVSNTCTCHDTACTIVSSHHTSSA